jgi:ATP-binding cassette subfamily F protein uup
MATLEREIAALETQLAEPALYGSDRSKYQSVASRLDAARTELAEAEERWLAIELAAEQAERARAR